MRSKWITLGFALVLSLVCLALSSGSPTTNQTHTKEPAVQNDQRPILERLRDLENQIQKDQDQIKKLEDALKRSNQQLSLQLGEFQKNEVVWGEWHFDHTNPEKTGLNINLPATRQSTVPSKKVQFRFPRRFDTPPKVHVCVNFIAFQNTVYIVEVKNVTEEGFELYLDKDQGSTFWEHLRLTWFAVPDSPRHRASQGQILN